MCKKVVTKNDCEILDLNTGSLSFLSLRRGRLCFAVGVWWLLVGGGQSFSFRHESVLVAQSCLTLCDPKECSPPGFSVHDNLQARILEWVVI